MWIGRQVLRIGCQRRAVHSTNANGKIIMMRKTSQLELQAADSQVDLIKLRQEVNELKRLIDGLGFQTLTLPPDEESPFSCRIARYAVSCVPGQLALNVHPDGKSPAAHFQIKKALQDHKIYLPVNNLFSRKEVFQFDARDIINIGGIYVVAQRSDKTGVLEMLNEKIQPKGMKSLLNRSQVGKFRTMRAISFTDRGLHLPLRKLVATIDGHSLVVNPAFPNMMTALQQSAISLAGGNFEMAPPHTTECLLLNPNSEIINRKSIILVPLGFPDVEGYIRFKYPNYNIIPIAMSEILKMGISLHEMLLPINPVIDKLGGMSGAFTHGDSYSSEQRNYKQKSDRDTGMHRVQRDPNETPRMPPAGSKADKAMKFNEAQIKKRAANRKLHIDLDNYYPGISKGVMEDPDEWVPGGRSPATFQDGWIPRSRKNSRNL